MRTILRQTRVAMLWFGVPALALTIPFGRGAWPLGGSVAISTFLLTLWMWPGVLNGRPVSVGRGVVIGGLIPVLSLIAFPVVSFTLMRLFPPRRGEQFGPWILFGLFLWSLMGGLIAAIPGAIAGGILAGRARAAQKDTSLNPGRHPQLHGGTP